MRTVPDNITATAKFEPLNYFCARSESPGHAVAPWLLRNPSIEAGWIFLEPFVSRSLGLT